MNRSAKQKVTRVKRSKLTLFNEILACMAGQAFIGIVFLCLLMTSH